MNRFTIPKEQASKLDSLHIEDTRRFVFDAPVYRGERRATWHGSNTSFVAIERPLSKRTAKHDKLAVRASRDGIKPFRAPDYAARNAGLIGTIH